MAEYHLWDVLDELRSPNYAWVDLTHSLDNNSPVWSGIPAGSVELAKTVYDWGNEMLDCLIQTFKFPGQFGTHIDFPGHFVRDAALSEKYGVHSMIYPLCVIDITAKAKQDIHYAVTIEDILDYENKYGTIPSGAFVALRTDWARRWPDMGNLSGTDENGADNFPGWSVDALRFLYEERGIAMNGWTPMLPSWRLPQGIWRRSVMCCRADTCRWNCWQTWTRSPPRALWRWSPGPTSMTRPVCPAASLPSLPASE